jgi:hypothetical protein
LSEWWVVFDQHFNAEGELEPNIKEGVFNTSIYGEYGITDRLTAIVNAPLFTRNYREDHVSATTGEIVLSGEAINGMGDIDVGLKYGLTKLGSRTPVSATLFLGLPTGKTNAGDFQHLQTGDGEFNQMIQLDIGRGFKLGKNTSAYATGYVGFNNRTQGFSEEFRYGVEVGAGFLNQKFWLTGRVGGVESLKNGDAPETFITPSLFSNNTEFISFSLEANYYVTQKAGLSASFAGAFRAESVAGAPIYAIGVFYDMSK